MVDRASRAACKPKRSCESVGRDSHQKPVLASGDETQSRPPEKFFYCQKPRLRVRATGFCSCGARRDDICRARSSECVDNEIAYGASAFLRNRQSSAAAFRASLASSCERFVVPSTSACRASPRFSVNTSLSRKLFFSTCWCIRNGVHFDSRVHAATKPSHTYIGGQHGQES